jgi:predicted SAM-dependent methyltransferase
VTRLNLGCGAQRLGPDWVNIDQNPAVEPDWCTRVPPIDRTDESVAEIYIGHMLEHLEPGDAGHLLLECHRVLVPGGRLGVVVPDTRRILACYLRGDHTRVEVPQERFWELDDLDDVCAVFLYSTFQDSPHRWSYDATTLKRALTRAGFEVTGRIDPFHDRRLAPAMWNLGFDCVKPAKAGVAA